MTLTNEEIIKIFSMYQPCDCMQADWFPKEAMDRKMICVDSGSWQCRVIINKSTGENYWFDLKTCKLLLNPISLLTDEHAIEISKLCYPETIIHDHLWFPAIGKELADLISKKTTYSFTHKNANLTFIRDYLIQHKYSVPLFFGLRHWANGKTPIELEVARKKPDLAKKLENFYY